MSPFEIKDKIKYNARNLSLKIDLTLTLLENNRSVIFEATIILPFLSNELATISQIDSNTVSNSNLKPDLCNCVKIEIAEATSPPQWSHKRSKILLGYCVDLKKQPVMLFTNNGTLLILSKAIYNFFHLF